MMRLIRAGLMYGNLYEVRSPAMVERYNRALEHLTGKRTDLTEFHIDIVGASPEIADELNDELYLNPNGANQMFILLSTDQKTAPLLNSQFSTSRSILRRYIEENEDQLFALTAREAVAGELMNSVFKIDEPADLLDINQVEIVADTTQAHVAEADALSERIDRFMREDDAWWDDVLIAEMIELAKRTGNIQRNPVTLASKVITQGNYFTSHFGGVYVFRDTDETTVIARNPVPGLETLSADNIFTFADREGIARWLLEEYLMQYIVRRPNDEKALVIRQKMDFIVVATAADQGHDLSDLSRQDMRRLERIYADRLPEEFDGLMDVWRWASMGGREARLKPDHPAYFYAMRGTRHKDRDLVNMLLSDLSRLDFRQLFICHKPLFYQTYRGWSDSKKAFVVRFLEQEYMMDKTGAREALFGPEPTMREDYDRGSATRKAWGGTRRSDDDFDGDDDDRDGEDWRHRSEQRRRWDKKQREKDKKKKRRR